MFKKINYFIEINIIKIGMFILIIGGIVWIKYEFEIKKNREILLSDYQVTTAVLYEINKAVYVRRMHRFSYAKFKFNSAVYRLVVHNRRFDDTKEIKVGKEIKVIFYKQDPCMNIPIVSYSDRKEFEKFIRNENKNYLKGHNISLGDKCRIF